MIEYLTVPRTSNDVTPIRIYISYRFVRGTFGAEFGENNVAEAPQSVTQLLRICA